MFGSLGEIVSRTGYFLFCERIYVILVAFFAS